MIMLAFGFGLLSILFVVFAWWAIDKIQILEAAAMDMQKKMDKRTLVRTTRLGDLVRLLGFFCGSTGEVPVNEAVEDILDHLDLHFVKSEAKITLEPTSVDSTTTKKGKK